MLPLPALSTDLGSTGNISAPSNLACRAYTSDTLKQAVAAASCGQQHGQRLLNAARADRLDQPYVRPASTSEFEGNHCLHVDETSSCPDCCLTEASHALGHA